MSTSRVRVSKAFRKLYRSNQTQLNETKPNQTNTRTYNILQVLYPLANQGYLQFRVDLGISTLQLCIQNYETRVK